MERKVLFVHDGPIGRIDKMNSFYSVHYKDEIIERYSNFGSRVTFLMRSTTIESHETDNYTKISHKAFNFIDVPNFKSIRRLHKKNESKKIIEKAVRSHDVLIIRLPSAIGTIAFKFAKKLGKPILIEMVACVFDSLWNYDWRGKLIAKSRMRTNQKMLFESSHVIYVTEKYLQKRYPTLGKSIGCSDVVLSSIDESIIQKRICKIESLSLPITLGTVAAIDVPYKGQKDVIECIKFLKDQGITFKYRIVGQGDPSFLQKIISDYELEGQIEMVGPLQHTEVFKFMDEIDIYIQPSKTEGLPRSVVEAMSRGCTVLGSNIGGIPELISKDALFTPGNISELSNLLNSINKDILKKWSFENFENSKKFQSKLLNQKRLEFYEEFKKDFEL